MWEGDANAPPRLESLAMQLPSENPVVVVRRLTTSATANALAIESVGIADATVGELTVSEELVSLEGVL